MKQKKFIFFSFSILQESAEATKVKNSSSTFYCVKLTDLGPLSLSLPSLLNEMRILSFLSPHTDLNPWQFERLPSLPLRTVKKGRMWKNEKVKIGRNTFFLFILRNKKKNCFIILKPMYVKVNLSERKKWEENLWNRNWQNKLDRFASTKKWKKWKICLLWGHSYSCCSTVPIW